MNKASKTLVWVSDSRERLRDFPEPVQHTMGYALFRAQEGKKHPNAKPLQGFKGAGVLEEMDLVKSRLLLAQQIHKKRNTP